jgi:hypothetical protein
LQNSSTDEHRFYIRKRLEDKRFNGTRINADEVFINKNKDKPQGAQRCGVIRFFIPGGRKKAK